MEYSDIEIQEDIERNYAQKLCDATAWFGHARALIASARISKERASILVSYTEKSELENVCTLLYGLALENLFKAIWIYRRFGTPYSEDWMPGTKFPSEIKTHNLVKLAELIEPKLIEKYEFSLQQLTEATIWSGRYPCEVKASQGSAVRSPDIHEDAEAIYAKYRKYFTLSS